MNDPPCFPLLPDPPLVPTVSSDDSRLNRREILRAGLIGFSSLTLPGLISLRARAAATEKTRTAIILVWLRGGASHLETFDPKPEASSDYRGPYGAIETNVPGIWISELLPRLSKVADKYALLRSMAHTGGGHPAGSLQVLAGDPDAADKPKPVYPDWMSVVNYLRRDACLASSACHLRAHRYRVRTALHKRDVARHSASRLCSR